LNELFECQICGLIFFENMKDLKEHLKCYHPKEFDLLESMYREKEN